MMLLADSKVGWARRVIYQKREEMYYNMRHSPSYTEIITVSQ